jgi:DNA-binding protein HU-beta
MSKQILVDAVKKTGVKSGAANEAVEAIVAAISRELKKNQRFSLAGFGSFAVSRRSARMGRNPRTGEPIKIKASKGVRFKAGTRLRASL